MRMADVLGTRRFVAILNLDSLAVFTPSFSWFDLLGVCHLSEATSPIVASILVA